MSDFFSIGKHDILNRSAVDSVVYIPSGELGRPELTITTQDVRIRYMEKVGGTQLLRAMEVLQTWLVFGIGICAIEFSGYGDEVLRVMPEVREWQ